MSFWLRRKFKPKQKAAPNCRKKTAQCLLLCVFFFSLRAENYRFSFSGGFVSRSDSRENAPKPNVNVWHQARQYYERDMSNGRSSSACAFAWILSRYFWVYWCMQQTAAYKALDSDYIHHSVGAKEWRIYFICIFWQRIFHLVNRMLILLSRDNFCLKRKWILFA